MRSTASADAPRIGIRTTGSTPPSTPRDARLRTLTPEVPLEGESATTTNSPPRPLMLAAVAMAILAIAAAAGARLTGSGHMTVPATPIEIVRDFRFDDAPDGSVVVLVSGEGAPEREVARLRTGELMFVRSTVRALARGRRMAQTVEAAAPFRLTRYQNGRVTLDDPSTGAHLELASFGPSNQAAFEQLLDKAR
ncbi:MAG TPA: photosynthetic complex assembly protein PuhC [Gemmatirosa sp.]|nr:photosynthetic complex assembly protein PuhC [Gemmatirosa sp.]